MPQLLPNLDDRRWADLVEEGRALIPVFAPNWTDHNVHDPGVTFLELLAGVAEMDMFQLNRIPDRHKRKFLALAGFDVRGPLPSLTVLAFTLNQGAAPSSLPAGTELVTVNDDGEEIPFRLLDPVNVVAGRIAAVLVDDGSGLVDHSQHYTYGEPIQILGAEAREASALYLGLTAPLPHDVWATVYFRFTGSRSTDADRMLLLEETRAGAEACRPRPNPCASPSDFEDDTEELAIPAHQSARLQWEYRDASGEWTALEIEDQTRGLTLDGRVLLRASSSPSAGGVPGALPHLYYLRAVLQGGRYDRTPVASRIVLNAAAAEQTRLVESDPVATGNGETDQEIELKQAPVADNRLSLWSTYRGQEWTWIMRPDFDASKRTDRHFTLDAQAGSIRFGDAEKGRAPEHGEPFRVSYYATRAELGNFPEGRHFFIDGVPHVASCTNIVPAEGGVDAENIHEATGRVILALRAAQRAVTIRDYETLTLQTPGTDLARVAVVPNHHPAFDCVTAPGVVTVIPVPHLPLREPQPTAGTLDRVRRYLNRRRTIGTRIEVVSPRYLRVGVRSTVRALPGVSVALLEQRLREALDRFLSPLVGGPSGTGWPFGRDVYRSEAMQVVDETAGVDHVLSLELIAGSCGAVCGNVCIPALWMASAGTHEIQVVSQAV